MTNPDANLWQSAQNILRAQENLNKLLAAFSLIECSEDRLVIKEEFTDDAVDEFLHPVRNVYFSVRTNPRANAAVRGWITIAIQLTSTEVNEGDWVHGKRAKVLVGYNPSSNLEYWEFDEDAPDAAGKCETCIDNETHWIEDDENDLSWFYAIPLDELTSTTQVRELIVKPVHNILSGCEVNNGLQPVSDFLCLPPPLTRP